jgi:hypothetical protein
MIVADQQPGCSGRAPWTNHSGAFVLEKRDQMAGFICKARSSGSCRLSRLHRAANDGLGG